MPEIDDFTTLLNLLTNNQPTPLRPLPLRPLLLGPDPEKSTPEPIKTKPKLCQHTSCNKKLMLSDFACRCANYYCGAHRHAESHACVYDFKKQGATLLEKQLVKAVASKLDRV